MRPDAMGAATYPAGRRRRVPNATANGAGWGVAPDAGPAQRALWEGRALATLRLVREGSFPAPLDYPDAGASICSPLDVFRLMQPYADREVAEAFWLLLLDAQHCTGEPAVITRGTLNASLVHPREVFRAAIVGAAAAVILCHNHPSGDPTPSPEDRAVTDQLVAAGKLLDIPVHDHVIVGRGRYASFAEAGLL